MVQCTDTFPTPARPNTPDGSCESAGRESELAVSALVRNKEKKQLRAQDCLQRCFRDPKSRMGRFPSIRDPTRCNAQGQRSGGRKAHGD
jgi:hypothetical protein